MIKKTMRCIEFPAVTAQIGVEGFNERLAEFGIKNEPDIISVGIRVDPHPSKMGQPDGSIIMSTVIVTIVYWTDLEKD